MEQETAKRLFLEGGTLIILDVPEGTEFGIDLKSWTVGKKFKGVKMIPPGIHIIHYNSVSNSGDMAPTLSFFKNFRKSDIVVKKWDSLSENIKMDINAEIDLEMYRTNLMEYDQYLGPYPFDILERWSLLTTHVSENVVEKLSPKSGEIRAALDLVVSSDNKEEQQSKILIDNCPSTSTGVRRPRSSNFMEDIENNLLPKLKPVLGTELRFSAFPVNNFPEGSTPSEITHHSLDLSYTFDYLICQHNNPLDLIGELQFTYLCFFIGHSMEAFEHWKKLVTLFCSCENAIKKHRNLYDLFISSLELHVKEIPEEFLADIVTNNNFVYVQLRKLFSNIQSVEVDGRLKTKAERFKDHLTKTYGWDFTHLDSEDEDDAPVIVEM